MRRKLPVSHEVVIDVLKRLLAEIDDPTPLVIPDLEGGLEDLDGYFKLLMTDPAAIVKSLTGKKAPEPVSGTQPITIRLHKRVINAFKAESARTGTSYQTLMHRTLAAAADGFAL